MLMNVPFHLTIETVLNRQILPHSNGGYSMRKTERKWGNSNENKKRILERELWTGAVKRIFSLKKRKFTTTYTHNVLREDIKESNTTTLTHLHESVVVERVAKRYID